MVHLPYSQRFINQIFGELIRTKKAKDKFMKSTLLVNDDLQLLIKFNE